MTTNDRDEPKSGSMTTSEAGHKGGQRVRELIEEGKQQELRSAGSRETSERSSDQPVSQSNREGK